MLSKALRGASLVLGDTVSACLAEDSSLRLSDGLEKWASDCAVRGIYFTESQRAEALCGSGCWVWVWDWDQSWLSTALVSGLVSRGEDWDFG